MLKMQAYTKSMNLKLSAASSSRVALRIGSFQITLTQALRHRGCIYRTH